MVSKKLIYRLFIILLCRLVLIPLAFVFVAIPNMVIVAVYEFLSLMLMFAIGQNNISTKCYEYESDYTKLDKLVTIKYSIKLMEKLSNPFGKNWWKK